MEVRRNTRTAPATSRRQFAQAEQTDFRGLQQGVANLAAGFDAGRRQRQQFELQKRLLEENNALQADLEQRRRATDFDPTTFAERADSDYTDRVNAVVDEYRMMGYDPDLVDDFLLGMGRVRNQLSGSALDVQQEALATRAVSDANKLLDEGTRQVVSSPDEYDQLASFLEDTIALNPDLTDVERTRLLDTVRPALRLAGAESLAKDNPQFIIDQLDPNGRWRQERTAPVTGTAVEAGVVAVLPETDPANRVMNYEAQAVGIKTVPADVRTLGDASAFAKRVNAAGADSSAMGVYQIVGSTMRLYGPKVFGVDWKSQPYSFASQDALAKAIFEDHKNSARALKNQWVSLSIAEADRIRKLPWEEARILIAKKESSADLSDLVPGGERVPQAGDVQAVAVPQSTAGQDSNLTEPAPDEPIDESKLHPILRDLTGPERLKLLSQAQAATEQNNAMQRAALDVVVENVKAEALTNGQVATPIPTEEELIAANGPVAGPQIYSDMMQTVQLGESLKTFATMHPDRIAAEVARLQPKAGSPTFATDARLFEAAQKAQAQLLEQRAADPAGYVLANFPAVAEAAANGTPAFYKAMDRALEQLGFDPKTTSPMSLAMQERVVEEWDSMPPKARRQWLGDQFRTMGEDRLKRFARGAEGTKLEEELKIYAFMRSHATASAVDEVFTGLDIMRKDPARRPTTEQTTKAFRGSAFDAVLSMAPDASAALREAADAIYVARGGRVTGPAVDSDAYKKALQSALGGAAIMDEARGAVKDKTILPRGITTTRFTNWVEQLQPGELTRLSVGQSAPVYGDLRTPVKLKDIVEDGVFVMWAPGLYRIRMVSDGGYLKTASGKSFIVKLRPEDIK